VRLRPIQWLWLAAVFALFVGLLLDVAGVINPPNLLWIVGSVAMMLLGFKLMPSLAELRKVNRRG